MGTAETIGGDIRLNATEEIKVAGGSSVINLVRFGSLGKGSDITIDSGSFLLRDRAVLEASTSGQGNAGNVTVRARDAVSLADADIFSTVESGGVGKGGNIDINAATLSLIDGAQLAATTREAFDTQPAGRGDAGNVNINVTGSVDIAGEKNGIQSVILSSVETGTVGNGGNITINSGSFSLQDGAKLSASTSGRGNAGNVNVNVTGSVDIAGDKNAIQSAILSRVNTGAVGNGGNITIDSGSFLLRDRAVLEPLTLGLGNAGNVTVRARDAVSLADASILSTVESGGVGKGGNIDINAATLSLIDGAQLLTLTRRASNNQPAGRGDAGNINVNIADTVNIAGEKNGFSSAIASLVDDGTIGNGGNITIDSGSFLLRDSARLEASTLGLGNAGNVTVRARDAISLTDASILSTVESGGVGKGGNIDISAATLSLMDGTQLVTTTREAFATQPAGRGNAGNVNINVTGVVDIAGAKNRLRSGIFSNVGTGAVGNGGNITINSGSFKLRDGAGLQTSTSGLGNAGNVTLRALDAVFLTGQRTAILSTVESGGVGKGGNIDINAATLSLIDGAQLATATRGASATATAGGGDAGNVNINVTGSVDIAGKKNGFASAIFSSVDDGTVGNGGNITIDSGSFSLRDGAQLSASTFGQGNAGNVTVSAKDAVELASTSIRSTVEPRGEGKGGNININAATLSLIDGAQLLTFTRAASATQPAVRRDAGNVNVQVTGAVDIAGEKNGIYSGILSFVQTGTVGNGGNITINSGSFSLRNGAQLQAFTSGLGNAGNVAVSAKDTFSLVDAIIFSSVEPGGEGKGGNINIDSGEFSLRDGAQLQAFTSGLGNAGNVTVSAKDTLSLVDAIIFSSVESGGVGKGGNIDINAATLRLTDGAQLATATRGASATQPAGRGDAGNVNMKVTGAVDIAGEKNTLASGILSSVETGTVGNGGNITIDSGLFSLLDGAGLTASTLGQGNAGTIKINTAAQVNISGKSSNLFTSGLFVESQSPTGTAGNIIVTSPRITLDNSGTLNAESASGNGGDINLETDLLLLRRGAQISTTAGTAQTGGNGGNINIDASSGFIVAVPNENSDITANAFTGAGGRVNIKANGIYGIEFRESPTPLSDITASSEFGTQGTVELNTPGIDPNSGLVNLPTVAVDTQIAQGCYSPGYAQNSFIITGRGGLPPNPREAFSSNIVRPEWATLGPSNDINSQQTIKEKPPIPTPPAPIVEATGWGTNSKGEIVLTANASTGTPHKNWQQLPVTCSSAKSADN